MSSLIDGQHMDTNGFSPSSLLVQVVEESLDVYCDTRAFFRCGMYGVLRVRMLRVGFG